MAVGKAKTGSLQVGESGRKLRGETNDWKIKRGGRIKDRVPEAITDPIHESV